MVHLVEGRSWAPGPAGKAGNRAAGRRGTREAVQDIRCYKVETQVYNNYNNLYLLN